MDYGLINKTTKESVALKAVDVSGELAGEALWVKILQKYLNDTGKNAELIYTFPLPEQAAVCDFTARIGNDLISGNIVEKEQAFREYDEAMRRGDSAFILENVRPNVFQISLGQIDAGEEVEIAIAYFQETKTCDGEIRLSIPTLLAPRYIPGSPAGNKMGPGQAQPTERVPDADFISPPMGNPDYPVAIRLNLDSPTPISSIGSPSHQIVVEQSGPQHAEVRLAAGSSRMNRDFILNIHLKGEALPCLIYGKGQQGEYFAYASFTPELPISQENPGREYIFLIDISGSMGGEKLRQAANALQICLRNLGLDDTFNLVAFESETHTFSPDSISYNQKNLESASTWVNKLEAMGGTNILPAVELALSKVSSREKIMLLFTDGQVGNEAEIISYVKDHAENLRLFSVGIDTAVNSYFINEIAEAGNGCSEFVFPDESLEDKILRHFSRINAGVMDHISLILPDVPEAIPAGRLPARLYDLEPCSHIFKLSSQPKRGLSVKGQYLDQEISLEIEQGQELKNAEVLEKLWAKRKIAELESYLANTNPRRLKNIQADIIETSQKYRVVSSLTSLLAIYNRHNKLSGLPETVVIPVDTPYGWTLFKANDASLDAPRFLQRSAPAPASRGPIYGASVAPPALTIHGDTCCGPVRESALDHNIPGFLLKKGERDGSLKRWAATQNSDGSFGYAQDDPLIEETAFVIAEFCRRAGDISLYRGQLKKAIAFLMSREKQILANDRLIKEVNTALEAARSRKVLRSDNKQQLRFAARVQAAFEKKPEQRSIQP